MGVSAIIFDVDGVIFNSTDSAGNFLWCKNIENDLGLKTSEIKNIFSGPWLDVIKGKTDTKNHLEKALAKTNKKISVQDFISYWLDQDANINNNLIDVVHALPQPAYLGTNQDTYRTAHIKKLVGKNFRETFSSCDIGFMKPEKEFFDHIENTLNLAPADLLLVDDSQANIEAAQRKGWKTYHFNQDTNSLKNFLEEI